MAAPTVQLDLFAGDPEVRRLVDGLTVLRDVVPEALEAAVYLGEWRSRGGLSVGKSGPWWYGIRRGGLQFEALGERRHSGWPHKLTRSITWEELAGLLGDDPRRQGLIAWAESLTALDAWRDLMRPHELWPMPGEWHPSYITGDHERPGWPERIAAWTTLQAMCTDTITALEAS
ncbi:hypothetical protein E1287_25735 [Actinomadura sp. KC06]|uniref:hypothetical protein n=1 Tax=Actinomadura sp. KC06 TaxID=2530369 RepID=UPI0010509E8F|nr:hypothetical protein [Actinomadura sp. KC06]TDD31665.1 hypothetical protein E1287_25735 [Actinomadura sp. KC06]